MEQNYNEQSVAYHGIKNAKYAIRENGVPGSTVVPFKFAKSVSFDPSVEQSPIYFNNVKVMNVINDQGYTGAFGTSAQDRAFEEALGLIMSVENGTADININTLKKFDMYYEYVENTDSDLQYIVKVWALNIETSKPSKAHTTDTNSLALGEYSYPITVYGDKIKKSTGDEIYRDKNGNEITATRVICLPCDEGYDDFDKSVPIVKMPAAPQA